MRIGKLLTEEPLAAYVTRLAERHDIRVLGSGIFSQVFQHPKLDNVVVKVVSNRDQNFLRYLSWASEHQDNPFVPKLFDLRLGEGRGQQRFSIVFMEKLRPISKTRLRQKLSQLFKSPRAFRRLSSMRDNVTISFLRQAVKSGILCPHLEEVVKYLLRRHRTFDMHEENFMLRGNQLVFTDPVYSRLNYNNSAPMWQGKKYHEGK